MEYPGATRKIEPAGRDREGKIDRIRAESNLCFRIRL